MEGKGGDQVSRLVAVHECGGLGGGLVDSGCFYLIVCWVWFNQFPCGHCRVLVGGGLLVQASSDT